MDTSYIISHKTVGIVLLKFLHGLVTIGFSDVTAVTCAHLPKVERVLLEAAGALGVGVQHQVTVAGVERPERVFWLRHQVIVLHSPDLWTRGQGSGVRMRMGMGKKTHESKGTVIYNVDNEKSSK